MSDEQALPVGTTAPRIDSFEIMEGDCDQICTQDEKTWPIVPVLARIDSFEVIE